MKKSRIFLGASALVLAIAGIAATKASSKFVTYYYQQSAQVCATINEVCPQPGNFDCIVDIAGTPKQLFTVRSADLKTCSTPAKRSTAN